MDTDEYTNVEPKLGAKMTFWDHLTAIMIKRLGAQAIYVGKIG